MKGIILAKNEFTSKKNVDWVTFTILIVDKENFGRKEYVIVTYWVKKEDYQGDLTYKVIEDLQSGYDDSQLVEVAFDDSKRVTSVH